MRQCRSVWRVLWMLVLLLLSPAGAPAHPAPFTAAVAQIKPGGEVRLIVRFDLLAYSLNDTSERVGSAAMVELLSGPRAVLERRLTESRDRLLHGVSILGDHGEGAFTSIVYPSVEEIHAALKSDSGLPGGLEAELTGKLPAGARSVAFRFPEVLGPLVLTVERPDEEPFSEPLEAGAPSNSLPVRLSVPVQEYSEASHATAPGLLLIIAGYVAMGFRHIVPEGLDHMLFVVGLVLLNPRGRPLLFQVSAFTVATRHRFRLRPHSRAGLCLRAHRSGLGAAKLPDRVDRIQHRRGTGTAFCCGGGDAASRLFPGQPVLPQGCCNPRIECHRLDCPLLGSSTPLAVIRRVFQANSGPRFGNRRQVNPVGGVKLTALISPSCKVPARSGMLIYATLHLFGSRFALRRRRST